MLICDYVCYWNLQPPLCIVIRHALPAPIWQHVPSGIQTFFWSKMHSTHNLIVVSPCWNVQGGSQYYFAAVCSLTFPGSLSLQTTPGTLQMKVRSSQWIWEAHLKTTTVNKSTLQFWLQDNSWPFLKQASPECRFTRRLTTNSIEV